jgi:hypothetical protein
MENGGRYVELRYAKYTVIAIVTRVALMVLSWPSAASLSG